MRFLPPTPRSCLTGSENSSTGASPTREDIMLRMILLGMLIPLSVGVLAAMELRTPPRRGAAVNQPGVETVAIPDSLGALAKTDRLKVTYASTDTPPSPPLVDDRISTSQTATSNAPETLRPINLKGATASALKVKWRALFDTEPPPYNRRFLESRLAYRIQELAYGGLKKETVERLRALSKQYD